MVRYGRMVEQQNLVASAIGESLYRCLESVVDVTIDDAVQAPLVTDQSETERQSDLGGWVPTPEQADTLIEVLRLVVVMVLLIFLKQGHAISESTQLELEALISFVVVLNRYRRR